MPPVHPWIYAHETVTENFQEKTFSARKKAVYVRLHRTPVPTNDNIEDPTLDSISGCRLTHKTGAPMITTIRPVNNQCMATKFLARARRIWHTSSRINSGPYVTGAHGIRFSRD